MTGLLTNDPYCHCTWWSLILRKTIDVKLENVPITATLVIFSTISAKETMTVELMKKKFSHKFLYIRRKTKMHPISQIMFTRIIQQKVNTHAK